METETLEAKLRNLLTPAFNLHNMVLKIDSHHKMKDMCIEQAIQAEKNKPEIISILQQMKEKSSNDYYFVLYKWKKYGWKTKESGKGREYTGSNETECQTIIDIHPIKFQLDCNEKYGKEFEIGLGYTSREEYKVISWQKITKEEYDKYKGCAV